MRTDLSVSASVASRWTTATARGLICPPQVGECPGDPVHASRVWGATKLSSLDVVLFHQREECAAVLSCGARRMCHVAGTRLENLLDVVALVLRDDTRLPGGERFQNLVVLNGIVELDRVGSQRLAIRHQRRALEHVLQLRH